jgi:hypothetical protein
MANFLKGQSALYKLTAISAAGLMVGFGFCGAGTLLPQRVMDVFFVIGAVVFWLSVLGIGVSLVWWVIDGLMENGRGQK